MRKPVLLFVAAGFLFAASVQATTNVFNFDSDPAGILNVISAAGGGTWYPTNGSTLEPGVSDPSTNGYLAISDALNNQKATIIFDDFDAGLVVAGFTFSMDVRVGAGTDSPADGFSINYARANDLVITQADGNGFASNPSGEANLPEEGTQTGLAICFDEWYSGGADVIGLTIRVDNTIITNVAMPTLNGACTDPTSLQTGPNSGGVGALCWQPLSVQLTTDGHLSVSYKGVAFLSNFPAPFAPSAGRLILAGRTGGANANHHVDNIRIVTIPADRPVIALLQKDINANGFRYTLTDSGDARPDTNTIAVQLDGAAVTPTSITRNPPMTFVTYQNPNLVMGSGSSHTAAIRFTGFSFNGPDASTNNFTVPPYTLLTTAHLAPAAVNTTLSGLAGRVHQMPVPRYPDGASLIGIERQLAGGFIDPATGQPYASTAANGVSTFTSEVINWGQDAPVNPTFGDVGIFQADSLPPYDRPDDPIPGVDANANPNTDNVAAELLFELDLTPGSYQFGVNHDDGFKLTAGAEPRDAFKATLMAIDAGATENVGINFTVTNAGKYPFRLVWGENTGGAQLEFYSIDFNTGEKVLINNRTNPLALLAYRDTAALTQPYVRWTSPAPGETFVSPDAPIVVKLEDGAAGTITSVQVQLNETSLTANTTKAGTTTTATASHPTLTSGSTNTVTLVYSTTAGGPFTQTWQYFVAPFETFPPGLRTAVGSGDAAQPGFRVHTWQMEADYINFNNDNDVANMTLLGLNGTNAADPTAFTDNGAYDETSVINWRASGTAEEGFFTANNGYSDAPVPGLPGFGVTVSDNVSAEVVTYVEFPTAGFYTMGVQSDDGFRLTLGDTAGPHVNDVRVLSPAGLSRRYGAIQTLQPRDGFGGPLPAKPIIRHLVVADPILAGSPLNNAAAVAGNIVLVARGTYGFNVKAKTVQDAGGAAMILFNANQTNGLPQVMGGTDASVTIPCFMISYNDGINLQSQATTTADSPVTMSLACGDARTIIGEYNGGRGSGAPTTFGLYLARPGVYPMRLVWENAGGGCSVEWWTLDANGGHHLINDVNDPLALKAYRARTVSGGRPVLNAPVRSGGNVTISWSGVGELQEAGAVNGPYCTSANQANPQTFAPSGGPKFFRIRQY